MPSEEFVIFPNALAPKWEELKITPVLKKSTTNNLMNG
jgi:hypothetical protein